MTDATRRTAYIGLIAAASGVIASIAGALANSAGFEAGDGWTLTVVLTLSIALVAVGLLIVTAQQARSARRARRAVAILASQLEEAEQQLRHFARLLDDQVAQEASSVTLGEESSAPRYYSTREEARRAAIEILAEQEMPPGMRINATGQSKETSLELTALAVIQEWLLFEEAMRRIVGRRSGTTMRGKPLGVLIAAYGREVGLSDDEKDRIQRLARLRNDIVHNPSRPFSEQDLLGARRALRDMTSRALAAENGAS
jgi:hypothetical protein